MMQTFFVTVDSRWQQYEDKRKNRIRTKMNDIQGVPKN